MAGRDVYGRPARRSPWETTISRRALLGIPRGEAAAADIDFDSATERVRVGWDEDGHEPFLRQLEPVAELLTELARVGKGQRVLDAGAGDGNVAAAAAARGARCDACDISPHMVERGRARCGRAEPQMDWFVADVQALPQPEPTYDAVLSAFGASLAPRALQTARELCRVTRPGGVVALSAWSPRGLPGALDDLVEPFSPRPAGVPRPSAWGVEAVARRRLEPLLEDLELRARTLRLRFESEAAAFAALTRSFRLDGPAGAALRPGFARMLRAANNRPPAVEFDARYLVMVGRRSS